MIRKNIDECDSCGMGSIELPGDNPNNGYDGIKGSGDIPLGSKHVYKQIMTFDTFVKPFYQKKKNRKKLDVKHVSQDSPYYKHSPNPSEYSYVYDFKEYIKKIKDEL